MKIEAVKQMLKRPDQKLEDLEAWKLMTAGGIGGVMFWIFTYPIDMIQLGDNQQESTQQ